MALINLASREINYKIVYYGCGLSGKTTNIQHMYNRVNPAARGRLFSIATEEERTLYFDFLPLSLGDVRGLRTRFHIYTVPGQFSLQRLQETGAGRRRRCGVRGGQPDGEVGRERGELP